MLAATLTRLSASSACRLSPAYTSVMGVAHKGFLSRLLSSEPPAETEAVQQRIGQLVKQSPVVVFMKGVPEQPRCGFSNAVVQILRMHDVDFQAHDVLQDEEIRQGVKDFSEWPTIPQIYLDGEFVGGCDILLQMHQNGDLIMELKKIGITSALLAEAEAKAKAEEAEKTDKDK